VAHNFRLKGVPTLLRAMSRLAELRLPVHLLVVGGRHLRPWRRAAARLGVDRIVSFVGLKDDTAPYYAAADVYVHPTHYDPCSLVVLEAAASGLPVITTRINGVSELLHDGVDSLLIHDRCDADELAGRTRSLFDDPLRRAMGAAARQTALQHTLGRNVEQILDVYREVLGLRPGRSGARPPGTAASLPQPKPVVQ
jgi:UDP-glucose:(heptosyl)LPS alpha-1,3-glucosyltransferase